MSTCDETVHSSTLQSIRAYLEHHFVEVKFNPTPRPTYTFRTGLEKQSWLLVMNEELLTEHIAPHELQRWLDQKVLPKLHQNPGKRIQISKYRDVTVEEKAVS